MIVVRRALPGDHTAIVEFTRDTFSWGDYVPGSFLGWLDDDNSAEFVAVQEDDRPIGFTRIVQLSERETWAHGARVHPDHRRRGIGLALQRTGMDWSLQQGAIVNRLMTESWNENGGRLVAKAGYRPVASWFHASRQLGDDIGDGGPPPQTMHTASSAEVEPALMAFSHSDLANEAHGLIPIGWHMRSVRFEDLAREAQSRHLWSAPAGWVTIQPVAGQLGHVWIPWIVTIADDAYAFVRAIVAQLHTHGTTDVGALLPATPWLASAFEHAGFRVEPNIIWEIPVDYSPGPNAHTNSG